jgi:uncharacterized surface protein with fasciclin (FAS1) repeats
MLLTFYVKSLNNSVSGMFKKHNKTLNRIIMKTQETQVAVLDRSKEMNIAFISKAALMALLMVFFVNTVIGQETVVDIVVGSESHTTLEAAVIAAELADDLQGEGPFTVFAPTDAAFAALPEGTVESLLKDPTGDLASILLFHVVGAKAYSKDLSDGQKIKTMQGDELMVKIKDGKVYINGAMVSAADIKAGNGVIHVIDAVMLPPAKTATASSSASSGGCGN